MSTTNTQKQAAKAFVQEWSGKGYEKGETQRFRLLHRRDDSHKGDYGHLLIVAGCQTMPGAAVLATGAALKSGCGLVTLHSSGRALQAAANLFPSAMLSEDPGSCFSAIPLPVSAYSAIAVGPGLGQAPVTSRNPDGDRCRCAEHHRRDSEASFPHSFRLHPYAAPGRVAEADS